jgi:hypothetical protein
VCVLFPAVSESHEGKRKTEGLWPVFRVTHQRSRYIYDLFYAQHDISKELYEWLLREGYADAGLIAKWKKVLRVIFLIAFCFLTPGHTARVRKAVLFALRAAGRSQLCHHLSVPCTEGATGEGSCCRMCSLRLPRMRKLRLDIV